MKTLAALALVLLLSSTASALTFDIERSYQITEATGLLRNATGGFQGPGAGTGLLYGPFATVKLDDGFVVARLWSWHFTAASRVGGDSAPEGSKLSVAGGVAPITVMGVSFVADYNPIDGAFTWGAVTSLTDLVKALTSRGQ